MVLLPVKLRMGGRAVGALRMGGRAVGALRMGGRAVGLHPRPRRPGMDANRFPLTNREVRADLHQHPRRPKPNDLRLPLMSPARVYTGRGPLPPRPTILAAPRPPHAVLLLRLPGLPAGASRARRKEAGLLLRLPAGASRAHRKEAGLLPRLPAGASRARRKEAGLLPRLPAGASRAHRKEAVLRLPAGASRAHRAGLCANGPHGDDRDRGDQDPDQVETRTRLRGSHR